MKNHQTGNPSNLLAKLINRKVAFLCIKPNGIVFAQTEWI